MSSNLAERRLIVRVYHLWQKATGGAEYSRRSQIDPAAFGPDWAYCFMIDLDDSISQSRFSHLGKALQDLTWPTFERQCIGDCLEGSLLALAARRVGQLAEKKQVLIFSGSAIHQETNILYRTVLLPLSENGKQVDGVLGAIGYREITAEDGIAPQLRSPITAA